MKKSEIQRELLKRHGIPANASCVVDEQGNWNFCWKQCGFSQHRQLSSEAYGDLCMPAARGQKVRRQKADQAEAERVQRKAQVEAEPVRREKAIHRRGLEEALTMLEAEI